MSSLPTVSPSRCPCGSLKLSRQPYYRWRKQQVTESELVEAYRANALFDAHRDDPEFGYRFLVGEADRCTGQATRKTTCTRKAGPVSVAEQLVADCYQQFAVTPTTKAQPAERVEAAFDQRCAERSQAIEDLITTKHQFGAEADTLLEAHFADVIDMPTLKRHRDRIRIALADVTKRLDAERLDRGGPRRHLATALRLLAGCAHTYACTDDHGKRLGNRVFYHRILVTEDEKAAIRLNEPFAALAPNDVRCSSTSDLVEPRRFELLTSALQRRRSTN